jgi:DNA-binding transcriptional LysR family regulator
VLDYQTSEYGIYVVRPPGSYVPAKVRVLVDALAERFGGKPDWDPCLAVLNGQKALS